MEAFESHVAPGPGLGTVYVYSVLHNSNYPYIHKRWQGLIIPCAGAGAGAVASAAAASSLLNIYETCVAAALTACTPAGC